jgi:hypothetical protein
MFSIEEKIRICLKNINKHNDVPLFLLPNLYKDESNYERSNQPKKITKVYWTTKFFNRHVSKDGFGGIRFTDKNGDAVLSLDKRGFCFTVEYN